MRTAGQAWQLRSGHYSHRLGQIPPSAKCRDSGLRLRALYLRPARYRQVALTCFVVSLRYDAVLRSTQPIGLVRQTPSTHALQSPCEDERWRWFQAVALEVMLGFRTAGKSGPLDPVAAFHPTGSAGYCVAYETLLEGAHACLTSRTYTRW